MGHDMSPVGGQPGVDPWLVVWLAITLELPLLAPCCMQEDTILIDLVQKYGEKRWNMVANGLPGRTGKGCSHRCGSAAQFGSSHLVGQGAAPCQRRDMSAAGM